MHVCFLDFFIPILGEFGFSPFLLFSGLNGGRGEKRESPTETRPTGRKESPASEILRYWCERGKVDGRPFLLFRRWLRSRSIAGFKKRWKKHVLIVIFM
ncbi:unnamed protein product [Linum tenue]|uniref:Uncharacterized protein n=1 Tax=Linum tenue TaxID=586396 RepID=A0AAV0NJM6_9ROSI|nr:unnamed protein product [Linum tenue]